MNEDEDHVLDGQVISVVEPPTPFTLSGQVVGVTFGRPEEPGKPGRITIEVTSSSEHMPLLAPGDAIELHRVKVATPKRKSRAAGPRTFELDANATPTSEVGQATDVTEAP